MSQEEKYGLCFRCDYRARFYETGHGPRCECQTPSMSVYSCYMYSPVVPVIIKKNKGDRRPQFAGAMLSARSHFVRLAEASLAIKVGRDGLVPYWIPEHLAQRKIKRNNRYKILKESVKDRE